MQEKSFSSVINDQKVPYLARMPTTVSLLELTTHKFVVPPLFRCRKFYSATSEVFLRSRSASLSQNIRQRKSER